MVISILDSSNILIGYEINLYVPASHSSHVVDPSSDAKWPEIYFDRGFAVEIIVNIKLLLIYKSEDRTK